MLVVMQKKKKNRKKKEEKKRKQKKMKIMMTAVMMTMVKMMLMMMVMVMLYLKVTTMITVMHFSANRYHETLKLSNGRTGLAPPVRPAWFPKFHRKVGHFEF